MTHINKGNFKQKNPIFEALCSDKHFSGAPSQFAEGVVSYVPWIFLWPLLYLYIEFLLAGMLAGISQIEILPEAASGNNRVLWGRNQSPIGLRKACETNSNPIFWLLGYI